MTHMADRTHSPAYGDLPLRHSPSGRARVGGVPGAAGGSPFGHLELSAIEPGDVVMGTLPVNLAVEVQARGARYLHLSLDVPPELRGHELSAEQMERAGPRLEEYRIVRIVPEARS